MRSSLKVHFTWCMIYWLGSPQWLWLYQGNSPTNDYHLFTAPKQNLGASKFKDNGEVERVVSVWLITEDTERYNDNKRELQSSSNMINGTVVAGTTWKYRRMVVRLNASCSYQRWKWRAQSICILKLNMTCRLSVVFILNDMIYGMIWYIFINCSWVATRWQ
jgi:hypothetical protein